MGTSQQGTPQQPNRRGIIEQPSRIGAIVFALIVITAAVTNRIDRRAAAPAASSADSCVAGPNEQCPSDDFLARWDRWKDLLAQNAALVKDPNTSEQKLEESQDLMEGKTNRLSRIMKQECRLLGGCVFDGTKRKYVMAPMPVAPPAPQPAPAPAPNPAPPAKK